MNKLNELQDLYNETLDEFFEELYSHWDTVPEKIVSKFVNYFPKTISIIVSRGGDLSPFKKNVLSNLTSEIDSLKNIVKREREEKLFAIYGLPRQMPISYTQKDINERTYPKELKSNIDLCIRNITKLVLKHDSDLYSQWLRDDFPKLNHHEATKYMAMPDVCVSKLEQMRKIVGELSISHREAKESERLSKFEKSQEAWEQA
ncbi:hypothetical protein P3553_18630 [Vibrio parahaemolyticus]|uniref:hypothetical protein n=1 Tax=Vibrio parahaemolyticus TaxID=670 RepID=UPI001A8DD647|nr:hypothetical protein [Vibrio parahaemolyticus]EJG1188096.1 hypothetical protein [Vibrio parahaemolyticus]MBO0170215.1 hypothetical protein [Vibrio parahaemolyticus]MDF4755554.1 hypothetical protein [Vibrio parahaemolyticus]MDF4781857.1 hypothetical protein [Vibrio parahaemolyticus]MDF4786643.1 hypothetical protein [Vibrio parahaemolyticus]